MFKEFLERLKTTEYPLLGPNVWFIKKFGLRFPRSTLGKILCVSVYQSLTFHVITQYVELYLTRDDIESMIKNLNFSLLSIICVFKGNTMLYWQRKWEAAIDYVTEVDIFERLTQNSERRKIINRYTNQCFKFTYYYSIFVFCTNLMVITPNFVKYLMSSRYREVLRNGTEPFPHIFDTWMPFDDQQFPFNWVTVVWHVFVSFVGTAEILAFDLTTVMFMLFFGAEFEMLRLRSAELFDSSELVSEEQFDERVRLLHTLHTNLVKNVRLVSSFLSPVMFSYVLLCGLLFCTTGIQLSYITSTSQKLMLLEYMVFVLIQVFLYCWLSNEVLVKSSLLAHGPYCSAWWRGSHRQRRACVLLAGQMRGEHVFSAGPFTDLNLPTFVAILKGAYSYYTLLRN